MSNPSVPSYGGAKAGGSSSLEQTHLEDFTFNQQFSSYAARGFAVDLSTNEVLGNKAAHGSSLTSCGGGGGGGSKKRKADKMTAMLAASADMLDGDEKEEEEGPWAPWKAPIPAVLVNAAGTMPAVPVAVDSINNNSSSSSTSSNTSEADHSRRSDTGEVVKEEKVEFSDDSSHAHVSSDDDKNKGMVETASLPRGGNNSDGSHDELHGVQKLEKPVLSSNTSSSDESSSDDSSSNSD